MIGEEASHQDNNPLNNRLENLKWESHKENNDRKKIFGTLRYGSKHWLNKLNETQVSEIIRLRREKVSFRTIAKIFNVSVRAISKIDKKETWCHVSR
jgi:DNA invertase Pin-like site-specific DNA recombinase